MRSLGTLLLILGALAPGCRSPTIRPAAEIPVEQAAYGEKITSAEKETLVALARDTVPGREIRSIRLHSWYHPNDLPVVSVHFEPVRLDAERYEFVTLTLLNRNWHDDYTEPPKAAFPPETCWYLEKDSRRSQIKHRFRYRGELIFLSISKENTHQEIEEVLRMFERGKAVDKSGKTIDVLSDRADARYRHVQRYVEDGSVFVNVSYGYGLSGGEYFFELVGDTLVLRREDLWQA
jgi:hypothetical protein